MDFVGSTLRKHFNTFKVNSVPELQALLKKKHIFCIVIGGNLQEKEDIIKIKKICPAFPKIPCLAYSLLDDPELAFQQAKAGLEDFIPNRNIELLIKKLHHLKEKATFRIDLRDFGIDLNQCKNYWTKQFLKFILKDNNFLKYKTVNEIANKIGVSTANLDVAFKKDFWISPKQVVLFLRNYYAAYLVDKTKWSTKDISARCGFSDEREFYKSFRKQTGVTFLNFFREKIGKISQLFTLKI